MFDVGFSEIVLIAIVALIVVGPERLPKVARTLGHLFGRMQRYVNDVKADIAREMELDELRKLQSNVEDAARSIEQSLSREVNAARSQLSSVEPAVAGEAGAVKPQVNPATAAQSPAADASPSQLELGLDATSDTPGKHT